LALARADAALRADSLVGVDLAELALEQVIAHTPQAVEQGITLVSALQLCVVTGDPALLAVLLRNLLENALRYTPQGGVVTVTTGPSDAGALLEVEDTGPGIDREERERVFERFYRVVGQKASGSGLGLSIAQRIVELHGATITILDGSRGRGARVRICFPRRDA
jgi:signal transduction histidine kinase